MPTYQYACNNCGGSLEKWQRFEDKPLTICPSCGGSLRKVFQPAPVLFKGSGWYCTDSRSNSKEKSPECESCPAKKAETASTSA